MNKINHIFNNYHFSVFLRDDVDLSVFNEIFKFREYKSCEDTIFNSKYPIIDIGAHAGFFSIYAYAFNKNVKIYAIEPEKNNLEFLNKNIDENKIKNIKIIEGAIGGKSEDGELRIERDSINHVIETCLLETPYRASVCKNVKNVNLQKIKIFLLKDFLKNNKIDKVSLIKMDIEGGEYDVLDSLDKEDFSRIENVILEYHDFRSQKLGVRGQRSVVSGQKNHKDLERVLREHGFSVQVFPSRFDKNLGFIFAKNRKLV